MKTLRLLTWFTQLGMSAVVPLVMYIWLGVFLRGQFGLGNWVVILGVLLGVGGAFSGFRHSLQLMRREAEADKKKGPPPVSYNDHM